MCYLMSHEDLDASLLRREGAQIPGAQRVVGAIRQQVGAVRANRQTCVSMHVIQHDCMMHESEGDGDHGDNKNNDDQDGQVVLREFELIQ